jgi:hypothetical protein
MIRMDKLPVFYAIDDFGLVRFLRLRDRKLHSTVVGPAWPR